MIHYNYASDFKIVETLKDEAPFRFTYSAKSGKEVVAEYNGTEFVNCIARDGELVVPVNAGSLGLGEVRVKREYFLTDSDFADGICHLVTDETTCIVVWRGETDGLDEVKVGVAPAYQKGDPFTFDDMTDAQKQDIADRVPTKEPEREVAEILREEHEAQREANETSRQAAEAVREATFQTNEAAREAEFGKAIQAAKDNLVVVNDLTTGGADKALSAEMGKELAKELVEIKGKNEERIELIVGGYFNMASATLGGTYQKLTPAANANYSCLRHKVTSGEVYRIVGRGPSNAVGVYMITNSDTIITDMVRVTGGEQEFTVSISQDGWLYYNSSNSGNTNYGVFKIFEIPTISELDSRTKTIEDIVLNLEPVEIEDTLTSNSETKALSARQGKILNQKTEVDNSEAIQMTEGYYYNTTGIGVGDSITYAAKPYANANCVKLNVKAGEVYRITGYGTSAVGLYALADANNVITECLFVADRRENPVVLDITEDGFLYVNNASPQEGDGVIKVNIITLEDVYNRLLSSSKPLSGKKIVSFGDSLTEFRDSNGKRYSDYIADITGAEVINVGIGGTQIRRRKNPIVTPISNNMDAYAGLDIVSLIEAVVQGDLTVVKECANWVKDNNDDDNTSTISLLESIDWNTVDAITIMGGTNDHKNGKHLGSEGSTSVLTTLGSINTILSLFCEKYKHIKVYWITPTVRYVNAKSLDERTDDDWSDVWKNETEELTLPQYVEAISSEVKKWHIPVCDMYWSLGWNKANFSNYFNDTDGTHPYKGFETIGRKISAFLVANKTF